jgi:hypothetical protein
MAMIAIFSSGDNCPTEIVIRLAEYVEYAEYGNDYNGQFLGTLTT